MSITPWQKQLVAKMKGGDASSSAERIPVRANGQLIAYLAPIGAAVAADPELVEKLCLWRAEAMECFLTVFPPSLEATRGYLEKLAVGGEDRLLFLVELPDGRRVGHIGLCNISENSAEVDNVMRGERTGVPGLMTHVSDTLCAWVRDELRAQTVYLNVLSNNQRAIESYERSGFERKKLVWLRREEIPGGYRYVPSDEPQPGNPQLVYMEA